MTVLCLLPLLFATTIAFAAEVPPNLTVEGIPPIAEDLRKQAAPFMEQRRAHFLGWRPGRREMLISTRFGETAQLHTVAMPGGARRQITFGAEPAGGGAWQPREGKCLVFSQDAGGSEFHQLHRLDLDGKITLLTDGKSRNTGARWARDGALLAYTSTRRNGKDNDLRVVNPLDPGTDRELLQVQGGGWSVLDWSPDGTRLLVGEYLSANESRLHVLDIATAALKRISPDDGEKVSWGPARFRFSGEVLAATDRKSEFRKIVSIAVESGEITDVIKLTDSRDVEEFDLSPDNNLLAYTLNVDGASRLLFFDLDTRQAAGEVKMTFGDEKAPAVVISNIEWDATGEELGFTFEGARNPADAASVRLTGGKARVERWTESETGGLDFSKVPPAELVRVQSFDGLKMSGFLYRPDPAKFPGKRPCVISIHGGPEGQSRPEFLGRWNYLTTQLGIAMFYPNVRGSDGFGKTFLAADNGFKREDSVRDIAAFIAALKNDAAIDGQRLGVMGGSYGGYMTLASLIHHGADLRCGVDIVGISNFLTFLKSTQEYRRDLRRVEYGDERDEKMAAHLQKISPTERAGEIKAPLFIIQGKNDPRVPVTEARQMAEAVRKGGGKVWYLEAADEGHGFAKKKNADFMFLSVVEFFREHLVK